jgi:hypothetical protein
MKIIRYTRNPADGIMSQDEEGEYVSWKDYEWLSKYADLLIEHSSMICLPKDLENLREANLAFAMENHNLKKDLQTAKS